MSKAFLKQPTVLQVLPSLNGGGVERGAIEMVEAVIHGGGRALVVSAGGRLAVQVGRAGGTHITLPIGKKDIISICRSALALKEIIYSEQVDIVHARSRIPAWSARWATRKLGKPLVTTWHGVHEENFPGKKYYNSVLASGDRVIAISKFIAQRLYERYGVEDDRLRLIPRGADMGMFDPSRVTGMQMHELALKWYIPVESRVIMISARLTEWKGHGWVFQALGILKQQGLLPSNWLCLCVGDISGHEIYANQLIALAEKLGVASHIRLVGHCSIMPVAYALADVVVVPSLKPEPFGRVTIEAQAMRRPVIAAAHGALVETIKNGETGYLVPPGDSNTLASYLSGVLSLPAGQREDMGIKARKYVLEHYSTRLMQQRTLSVYNELLPVEKQFAFLNAEEKLPEHQGVG